MVRRKSEPEGGGDTWLNTYADMVTLLLTFFAVLLSMSSVSDEKFNAFIESLQQLPPSVVENATDVLRGNAILENDTAAPSMDQLYKNLKEYVETNNEADAVQVSKVDGVVYVRFNSAIFFEPDKYVLRPGGKEMLSFLGDALIQQESIIRMVNVCGHTAAPSYATPLGHWMLSSERAAVVAAFFEEDKKFPSEKLLVLGYGKNFPVADNETKEGAQKNRRVELVIIGTEAASDVNVYSALQQLYNKEEYPTTGSVPDILIPPGDTVANDENTVPPAIQAPASAAPAAQ